MSSPESYERRAPFHQTNLQADSELILRVFIWPAFIGRMRRVTVLLLKAEMQIFGCCFLRRPYLSSLYHPLLFLFLFFTFFSRLSACPTLLPCVVAAEGRFLVLANNNLQIQQVTKADEGVYRCEASVEARGEIDFVDIAVVVNGELQQGCFCRVRFLTDCHSGV